MRYIGSVLFVALLVAGCAGGPRARGGAWDTLQGVVYDAGGAPLGWVEITIEDAERPDGGPTTVRSDVDGRFAVRRHGRGRFTVTARRAGYADTTATLLATDPTSILYLRMRSAMDLVEEAARRLESARPGSAIDTAIEAVEAAPDDPEVRFAAAAVILRAGNARRASEILAWFPVDAPPRAVALLRARIETEEESP